jgi:hypothetical protein
MSKESGRTHKFRGEFCYYADTITLYTVSINKQKAKRNMLYKLAHKIGLEGITFLTTYFDGHKDNYRITDLGPMEED